MTNWIGDVKNRRPQAEQFIFGSFFGFVTHPILHFPDKVVQVALDAVDLPLKQSETGIQDSVGVDLLLVEVCAVTGGVDQIPNELDDAG